MPTEYKVLVVEPSSAPPQPVMVTLENLRDAILKHPDLALDALRFAIQGGAPVEPTQPVTQPVRFGGDLPLDTPIFKLLPSEQAKLLSPAAAKLTKGDLLDLVGAGQTKKTPAQLNLSVEDVKSIEDAFHQQFTTTAAAGGLLDNITACCCPCCCCTAASVPEPIRQVA
jgi:hypothetical protein